MRPSRFSRPLIWNTTFWLHLCWLPSLLVLPQAFAQAPVDIPQTNLTPIGPSGGAASPPAAGNLGGATLPPSTLPSTAVPRIRPGSLPNPGFNSGGLLADPYALQNSGSLGPGVSVTPLGPPTPVGTPGVTASGPIGGFGGNLGSPYSGTTVSPPVYNSGPVGSPTLGSPRLGIPQLNGTVAPPAGTIGGALGGTYDGNIVGTQPFGGPAFPSTAYPSGSPSTLFPEGLFRGGVLGGAFGGGYGGGVYSAGGTGPFSQFKLIHGPRVRHTFIDAGDGPLDLETNESDISIAFAFPNFLYSNRPLFIVPSFSIHLWDGPDGATGSDLPPNVYSAFLDFGWQTDANQIMGLELGLRVGVFSEFDVLRDESLRIQGKGLASFRLTPATTFKIGAYYLDRNKIKILPAGGWLWQPNPYTRVDIFFPQPKFARYWRTIGTRDVWWYATGDYGGDNWTIERDDGSFDAVDINDLRVMLGLEWGLSEYIRAGQRTGFVEVGYAFDREVIYRHNPADNFDPDDGFMVRAGFGY